MYTTSDRVLCIKVSYVILLILGCKSAVPWVWRTKQHSPIPGGYLDLKNWSVFHLLVKKCIPTAHVRILWPPAMFIYSDNNLFKNKLSFQYFLFWLVLRKMLYDVFLRIWQNQGISFRKFLGKKCDEIWRLDRCFFPNIWPPKFKIINDSLKTAYIHIQV
jgi:hypothetical protein